MHTKKRPFLALAFGLLLAFVTLELGSRLLVECWLSPERVRDLVLPFDSLPYRPHPYIGWELTPSRLSRDGELANRQGFRGPERPIAKKPGTFRVACLGGSTTFTQKVKEEETYPVQLEAALRQAWPGLEVEVLNAGVKGYTSAESLMNLAHKVLDYQPDAIVVYHAINDIYPRAYPGFLPDYAHCRRVWAPEETTKSDALRLLERTAWFPLIRQGLTDYLKRGGLYYWVYAPDEVRQGIDPRTNSTTIGFRRNLTSICRIARARGITCVLASQAQNPMSIAPGDSKPLIAEMNEVTADVASKEQALFVDCAKDFPDADTFDPGDAVHMTGKGARVLAERIAAALVSAGVEQRRAPEPRIGIESRRTFDTVPSLESPLAADELVALHSERYLTPCTYRLYRPTSDAPASARGGIGPHDHRGFRRPGAGELDVQQKRVLLFLGGAATYGLGVEVAAAFPARVEGLLQERGMRSIVALNGGVPGYTTAESIGALHFRYLETNPEVVIIAHDFEDAPARTQPGFRTDYTHARKPFRFDGASQLSILERFVATPPEAGLDRLGCGVPEQALSTPRVPPATDSRNARPGPYATYRNLRTLVDLALTYPSVSRVLIVVPSVQNDDPELAAIARDYAAIVAVVVAETKAVAVTVDGVWTAADRLGRSFVPSSAGHSRLAAAVAKAIAPAR